MTTEKDIIYMRMAMELAERGKGFVNPNPLVGAVVVKDDLVIGEGWHRKYGCLHAEREALAACKEDPSGSTMYVTLEPCCHYGKQPPCTDAIIAAGISRVVVGIPDPNPLVAGKGVSILRKHGIEVECGLLEADLKYQNRVFLKYITSGRPWVTMKWAMTLDGKIAASTGDSRWVSGEESRAFAHELRGWNMVIMAGIGTVKADDPMLNCRIEGMRSPVRVIADSNASIDMDSNIVRTAGQYRTILAVSGRQDGMEDRIARLTDAGVEVMDCGQSPDGKVDLGCLFEKLGKTGIDSVLVEGGAELDWSLVESGFVDELYCFIAPKVIGGRSAKGPVGGNGFPKMSQAVGFDIESVGRKGQDILVHAFPRHIGCSHSERSSQYGVCHSERSEESVSRCHSERSEESVSRCHSERNEESVSRCHSERSEESVSRCHSERSEESVSHCHSERSEESES